jgi:ubiquinone/menaquinone biosynthesis C-methylase UbiE
VFDAVRALEIVLGDVRVLNLPGDEVLLGNAAPGPDEEAAARPLRLAYLRWRIPLVKGFEGTCPWAQVPEVEDRWIRATDDLLPNHPELLRLEPGSTIVDVCGGLGRVARRLAPAIGREGVIISIEMRRFLSERARRFACERDLTNLQFRPGLAERLPLPDGSVDAAVNEWTGAIWELGLGPAMVAEMARVVRPGGRIVVLESTEPRRGLLAGLARWWHHSMVPRLGAWLSGRREYRYLQTSIAAFPLPDDFSTMLAAAGLVDEPQHPHPAFHAQPTDAGFERCALIAFPGDEHFDVVASRHERFGGVDHQVHALVLLQSPEEEQRRSLGTLVGRRREGGYVDAVGDDGDALLA